MRLRFLVLVLVGLSGAIGCGLSAIATGGFDAPVDGGPDPDSAGPRADGASPDSAPSVDAAPDAGATDAEADRPDAGVIFRPTHILPVYSLTAGDVTITMQSGINTTTGFIALNGAPAALSPDIVITNGIAVWSVGALTVNAKLSITGDRPLVIVAARDVTISQTVSAYGDVAKPGPGGFAAAAGAGKGASGAKTANDASGGGGAGHGTPGAAGADKAVKGGIAGGAVNPGDTVLAGGSGGGNGGGFVLGTCGDQGRGGVGGGAIQISAVGKIRVTFTGGIDVGGGGGAGGCRNNGGQAFSGGGGGGAGGLVVLESVGGVELDVGSAIAASGGGGGGGGDGNANGTPGDPGSYPTGVAQGGTGGGSGGVGGVGGPFNSPPAPGAVAGVSGGGGGGATGRVFLRTRTAAALFVAGTVAARQTDDPTF